MKLFLAKDIRYRMSVGSDLSEAIPLMEKQRSQKLMWLELDLKMANQLI